MDPQGFETLVALVLLIKYIFGRPAFHLYLIPPSILNINFDWEACAKLLAKYLKKNTEISLLVFFLNI